MGGPTTLKRYRRGTHRVCDPAETLARIVPLLGAFGVTRLADITRLDRIGIPTYQAIRPSSRSLSVSQGKGLTPEAAKVSAAMESWPAGHRRGPTSPWTMGRASGMPLAPK